MGQERRSNLATIQLGKRFSINFDRVIDELDATRFERGRRLGLKLLIDLFVLVI